MPAVSDDVLLLRRARGRIARIRAAITAVDTLCSGTLLRRTKVCGKAGCRCAQDPAARHGPYWEWGHMKGGKLVHRMVSPRQAALFRPAIANYRGVMRLLRRWEAETERMIEAEARRRLR
ncbi:MAG: hypothetical protein E6H04_03015 [Bacillati bacterium ANGP1]|uniref:DUF6788 domain-containing protein n=1 Tax=Candidatus Segetimicrobium genomatis TaxID=2569760 RepID=A0A537JIR3_9BACT|nr:MAG: hypothetical protein E6H04_03015 [Terrabacteria group bacterium ANGP1]